MPGVPLMAVHIDEITNDVSVGGPVAAGGSAAPAAAGATAAQPSPPELVRARAQAAALRRSVARTAVEPRRRGEERADHG
jgi:hypothetical protein